MYFYFCLKNTKLNMEDRKEMNNDGEMHKYLLNLPFIIQTRRQNGPLLIKLTLYGVLSLNKLNIYKKCNFSGTN